MNNKFNEPDRLVQELEAIGLEAGLYRNRTAKRGWVVRARVNIRNIDDIITSKNMCDEQIWELGEGYPKNRIIGNYFIRIGHYFIREDGKITAELHYWNHYKVICLKGASDPIEIIKVNHLLSRIKRKLFGIRRVIKELIQEEK